VKGKRVAPGVCEYASRLELPPGQQAIAEDSLSFDDATCTMVVQRGTPTELSPDDRGDASGRSSKSGRAAPAAGGGGTDAGTRAGARTLARATATHSAGYYKSYFEDPVGIDVNSVRNNVDWYWNGSYVYNGYCSYSYGWFSASGWSLRENDFFCRYEN